MMTGYASVESAVNCMRAGAFDYIIKPLHEKYGQGEGELSDEDFEEMIEMERQKNTWTFEERWLSRIWDKWKNLIQPPGNPNFKEVGHDAMIDLAL